MHGEHSRDIGVIEVAQPPLRLHAREDDDAVEFRKVVRNVGDRLGASQIQLEVEPRRAGVGRRAKTAPACCREPFGRRFRDRTSSSDDENRLHDPSPATSSGATAPSRIPRKYGTMQSRLPLRRKWTSIRGPSRPRYRATLIFWATVACLRTKRSRLFVYWDQ